MRLDGEVDWSVLPAPAAGLRCAIVLPARDESLLLPRALRAISAQRGVRFVYEVIVLANNCSDETAARARACALTAGASPVHVVEVTWPSALANIGRARRALMEVAARRVLAESGKRGILASTDADTLVDADWLAAIAAAVDAGADAVGGRIVPVVDAALPSGTQRLMRLDDLYRRWRERLECAIDPDPTDPWPRHHQHFGASLAVRAATYLEVGGVPHVPFLEDEALVQALRRHDMAVRHSPDVRVQTSARLDGRAEVGLAWQLRAWSNSDAGRDGPAVIDPAVEADLWTQRRRLRTLWRAARTDGAIEADLAIEAGEIAWALGVDLDWLLQEIEGASRFGRLWADLDSQRTPGPFVRQAATVTTGDALRSIRCLLRARRALPG